MKKYVVYYRVSTKIQGNSGLGLEAQKNAVMNFLLNNGIEDYTPTFTEVESGKKDLRPELQKAIQMCKSEGATLLIAKLDRLSRNVAFIFKLKEDLHKYKVDFMALDLPEANTLTLGIMASMAQHEREIISGRTKAGLEAARRKGKILGSPQNLTDKARRKAMLSIKRNAREDINTRHSFHFIQPLREQGLSYDHIAIELNKEGYMTREGKQFHAMQVRNIYLRLCKVEQ